MSQASASASRIFEILDAQNDVTDKVDATVLPTVNGKVCFEDVTFRYFNSTEPVLDAISFEARPGETIALLGSTGSGKSEWLRMMLAGLIASNTPDTLRVVTLDPKLAAFADLERSPFLWRKGAWWIPGADRPASELFGDLVEEMERRFQLTRTTGAG